MKINEYLISVTALILLSEITRILLPKGKTKRVVEIVYSLVLILTLLSPIVGIAPIRGGDAAKPEFAVDDGYLEYADKVYSKSVIGEVERYLKQRRIAFSSVEVDCERFSIKKLIIYYDKNANKDKTEHIDSSEVRNELSSLLKIDAEVIGIVEAETG